MANLLVTGGAGFIGTSFVRHRLTSVPTDRIVVLDALTYAGNRTNLDGLPIVFVHGNVCNIDLARRLIRDHRIDTIVHFAAESHVDRSIEGSGVFVETNIVGTHRMLEAARIEWLGWRDVPIHRFHHISTDEVFGSLEHGAPPFTEETPYAPNSPYAASKAAADHLVRAYNRTYGLKTTISYCSNNYGPYQHLEKLIPSIIHSCLSGKGFSIYGDGLNVREWLHVEDHCRGIDLVLRQGQPGDSYNIGGGAELPNDVLADMLCTLVDRAFASNPDLARRFPNAPAAQNRPSVTLKCFVVDRPGHDRRYALNGAKARKTLGYKPLRAFDKGLKSTVEWYLSTLHP